MNLTAGQVTQIGRSWGISYPEIMAFIEVETGGSGFSLKTSRLIIQFEPTWFSKFLTKDNIEHTITSGFDKVIGKFYVVSGKSPNNLAVNPWKIINGVEGQDAEWAAFDIAFSVDRKAAMLSTSIGLMQIMGFNFSSMGYKTVDAMWDDFKTGEFAQLNGACKFIKNNPSLYQALQLHDWPKVAYYYNGPDYKTHNYDTKLEEVYSKYITTSA